MCWERSEPCLCCSTTAVHLEWNSAGQMTFSVMRPDLPTHFYSWIFLTLRCEIRYFFQHLHSLPLINPNSGCPRVFIVLNFFFFFLTVYFIHSLFTSMPEDSTLFTQYNVHICREREKFSVSLSTIPFSWIFRVKLAHYILILKEWFTQKTKSL